jgi:hypothetical protein
VGDTVRSHDGVAPLLLVHGGMRTAANRAPLWPLLTARYRVTAMGALLPVLPDARGTTVPGHGHDLVDTGPGAVLTTLDAFLT